MGLFRLLAPELSNARILKAYTPAVGMLKLWLLPVAPDDVVL